MLWLHAVFAPLGVQCCFPANAFEAVDGATLVYGIHLYHSVWHELFGYKRAAVIVGNDFRIWTES
jgi:hypothetical protein